LCGSQSSEATTAMVLHGYTLLQRQNDASANSDDEWQFALVRGHGRTFYVRTDTGQQLEKYAYM